MEKTFGPVLFDMINRRIPKERYILYDTKKEGRRPDTMKMLKDIYVAFKAEGKSRAVDVAQRLTRVKHSRYHYLQSQGQRRTHARVQGERHALFRPSLGFINSHVLGHALREHPHPLPKDLDLPTS